MGIKLINLPDRKDRYSLGKLGEELMALLLTKQGFMHLESNFRGVGYEVDLIMQKGDFVFAFEVKTTKADGFDYLFESIRRRQVNRLLKGVRTFCYQYKIMSPLKICAGLVDLSGDAPKIEIVEIL